MSTDDPVLFVSNRMCDIVPPRGRPRIIGRLNRAFTGRYCAGCGGAAALADQRVRFLSQEA
jgi:hypothetical protein